MEPSGPSLKGKTENEIDSPSFLGSKGLFGLAGIPTVSNTKKESLNLHAGHFFFGHICPLPFYLCQKLASLSYCYVFGFWILSQSFQGYWCIGPRQSQGAEQPSEDMEDPYQPEKKTNNNEKWKALFNRIVVHWNKKITTPEK